MEKKITRTEYFNALYKAVNEMGVDSIDGIPVEDVKDFIVTQVNQIAAKAEKAKERAATKKAEGDALREAVQAVLTSELQDTDEILAQIEGEDLTRAKISARLTQLVKAGVAEKEQVKGEDGKKLMKYRLVEVAE